MTSFDPLTALFEVGKVAIEKIWPDPMRRAEELRKLEELKQSGDIARLNAEVQLRLGQIEINKIEAAHKSLFVAGWRPAIGWVTVTVLACAYIPKILMITLIWSMQAVMMLHNTPVAELNTLVIPAFPELAIGDIIGLLGSMLGVGILRSVDKYNGKQTDSLGG